MMPVPTTLDGFFRESATRYRVYEMARGIRKVERGLFEAFEAAREAWPWPLQQHAWLAIVGGIASPEDEPFIWFLKFPLDEQGKLVQAARDDFLHTLLQHVGENIHAGQQGLAWQDGLRESPYGFKPKDSQMAALHALVTSSLSRPTSRYYSHARDYLAGIPGYDQWAFVGLQGLADVLYRLDQDDNLALLNKALPELPAAALHIVCSLLENIILPTLIGETLGRLIRREIANPTDRGQLLAALLRALAQSPAQGMRTALIGEVLASPLAERAEILAAIAARNWSVLQQPELAGVYLEALARNDLGQDAFNQILADLLYLPAMRPPLLTRLRDPQRSSALSQAVAGFFGQAQ